MKQKNLAQFIGILSDKDAKEMRAEIKQYRKSANKNAAERRKMYGL